MTAELLAPRSRPADTFSEWEEAGGARHDAGFRGSRIDLPALVAYNLLHRGEEEDSAFFRRMRSRRGESG